MLHDLIIVLITVDFTVTGTSGHFYNAPIRT